MKMKKVLSLVFLALFLISCSSTPITGRKQLLLVNEEETIQNSLYSICSNHETKYCFE